MALLALACFQAGRWSPRSARVPSVPSSLRSFGRRLPTDQLLFSLRALGPDAGRVLVNGSDLWRREIAARSDLAFVPQEPDVTPFATIREVLRLVCSLRSQPADQVDQVLAETELEDSADLSIRELSRGQRRRVLLAAAWIGTPRTAILDEPLDAMDEHWRSRTHGWLEALRAAGGLALVATHEAGSLAHLADRFLVLRDGEIRELDSLPQDTTWRSHEEPT